MSVNAPARRRPIDHIPRDSLCVRSEHSGARPERFSSDSAARRDRLAGSGIAELVRDGDTVALEGFTHLIPFAAGHEIIRQGRRDLTLVRMTPDIIYDQLIGMGCARRLVFSWGGNPGVGSLHRFRDAVEHGWPAPLELEEHSHAGMANRYAAGASGLPFAVLRGYAGSDLVAQTDSIGSIDVPFHRRAARGRQRAQPRRGGDPRPAGRSGRQRPALGHLGRPEGGGALAARRALVTVEELVERLEPRPGAVVLPAWAIDFVAHVPGGAHPSYAHGYSERDNDFYVAWDAISRDRDTFLRWMEAHVLARLSSVTRRSGRAGRRRR